MCIRDSHGCFPEGFVRVLHSCIKRTTQPLKRVLSCPDWRPRFFRLLRYAVFAVASKYVECWPIHWFILIEEAGWNWPLSLCVDDWTLPRRLSWTLTHFDRVGWNCKIIILCVGDSGPFVASPRSLVCFFDGCCMKLSNKLYACLLYTSPSPRD